MFQNVEILNPFVVIISRMLVILKGVRFRVDELIFCEKSASAFKTYESNVFRDMFRFKYLTPTKCVGKRW